MDDPSHTFVACAECDSAAVCNSFDSCGRGAPRFCQFGETPACWNAGHSCSCHTEPPPRVSELVG